MMIYIYSSFIPKNMGILGIDPFPYVPSWFSPLSPWYSPLAMQANPILWMFLEPLCYRNPNGTPEHCFIFLKLFLKLFQLFWKLFKLFWKLFKLFWKLFQLFWKLFKLLLNCFNCLDFFNCFENCLNCLENCLYIFWKFFKLLFELCLNCFKIGSYYCLDWFEHIPKFSWSKVSHSHGRSSRAARTFGKFERLSKCQNSKQ